MEYEEIALMAQTISWAFEDQFFEKEKRGLFQMIFERYLSDIDPSGDLEPYDAIVQLGRRHPENFGLMVAELKKKGLILKN